jgi:hypothetical protein
MFLNFVVMTCKAFKCQPFFPVFHMYEDGNNDKLKFLNGWAYGI